MSITPKYSVMRAREVVEIVGVTRRMIDNWIKQGAFPRPIHLGARSVGWLRADVEKWIQDRVDARDNGTGRQERKNVG